MKDPDLQLIAERYNTICEMGTAEKDLAKGQVGNVASAAATGAGVGTVFSALKGGAGYMQQKALDKAVQQGEISPQGAQQMMNAGNKPKGKSKGPKKLIKSSNKALAMEQIFNPAQVANELAANILNDPTGTVLQQIVAISPSIQMHPQVAAFAQQLQQQQQAAMGQQMGV